MDALESWKQARANGKQWKAPVRIGRAGFERSYELGRVIGRGGFGSVHIATHRASGTRVAVKRVKLPPETRGAARRAYEEAMRTELALLVKLSHPHIVSVIEAFVPDQAIENEHPVWTTVLELCSGCDLQTALESHGALSFDAVRAIAAQLASAIEHMHANGGERCPPARPLPARVPPSRVRSALQVRLASGRRLTPPSPLDIAPVCCFQRAHSSPTPPPPLAAAPLRCSPGWRVQWCTGTSGRQTSSCSAPT
jgi:hypothetical protein